MKRLLIVGAGGHGRSVAEAVLDSGGYVVVGFLDDAFLELKQVWDVPVLGKVAELAQWRGVADCAFVAFGNNVLRQRVTAGLRVAGFSLVTVRHPRTIVSPSAVIGDHGRRDYRHRGAVGRWRDRELRRGGRSSLSCW